MAIAERPRKRPIATVAIATYDRVSLLEDDLRSVLSQPVEDIEVLVVDDGSPNDSTRDLLDELGDPRLRYIRCEENGGVARARNRAVAEARSSCVVVHDDDDIFLPWRIEAHFDALGTGVDGTYGGWVDFDSEGELRAHTGKAFSLDAILYGTRVLLHPTLMIRTDVLAKFPYDETMRAGSDYNLAARLAAAGVRLEHTGQFHILRRLHEMSLTQTLAEHQRESARATVRAIWERLGMTDDGEGRRAARELEPAYCRGQDDLAATVGPYLPASLSGVSE